VSEVICKKKESKAFPNSIAGVNFINILHIAFKHADPKSAKKTVKFSVFFAILGSACAKAACRMLVKLTPGSHLLCMSDGQFHQHFTSRFFTCRSQLRKKTLMT
jgi:hypothetical protein